MLTTFSGTVGGQLRQVSMYLKKQNIWRMVYLLRQNHQWWPPNNFVCELH